MRQGPSNRRARGRGSNSGRRGNLPNRNQTFDSNGPDVRIRGTAFQVNEKYQALARDASASGDRIMAENYLQHAEHYHRIIMSINDAHSQAQQPDGAGREAGGRDGGHRHRDNGHRDNGHRDNGHRESGGPRGNGHQADRDAAVTDGVAGDPRASEAAAEAEFGMDPRQADVRDSDADHANGEAVAEMAGSQPAVGDGPDAQPIEADGANGDATEGQPARPRRRGPGRPRKSSAAAKGSAPPATEANTDGD